MTSWAWPGMVDRTVDNHAAFFLPHLSAGLSLLDVGCGPGTITVGLAERVAPGMVVGIDVGPSQIEKATKLSREIGSKSTTFEVGDAASLRFSDGQFDAVFSSATLEHVPDAARAVREIVRVLKPGGIVGLKSGVPTSHIPIPRFRAWSRALEISLSVWISMGGHPDMGVEQLRLVEDSGLVLVDVTGTFRKETPKPGWLKRLVSPDFVERAEAIGSATREEIEAIAKEVDVWCETPRHVFFQAWIEVVARKPE